MPIVGVDMMSRSDTPKQGATSFKGLADKDQQESDPQDPMPIPNIPGWRVVITPTTLGKRSWILD